MLLSADNVSNVSYQHMETPLDCIGVLTSLIHHSCQFVTMPFLKWSNLKYYIYALHCSAPAGKVFSTKGRKPVVFRLLGVLSVALCVFQKVPMRGRTCCTQPPHVSAALRTERPPKAIHLSGKKKIQYKR